MPGRSNTTLLWERDTDARRSGAPEGNAEGAAVIFREAGEVVPGFHTLGSWHTPSYLLDAPRPALFDGGMSYLADLYVEDARRVLGDREPEWLFLTHAHFDHCGAAHALGQAFPGVRVAASAYAADILGRPRALERIRALNEDARGLAPLVGARRTSPAPFHPFTVDRLLADGDELDLGNGLTVQVIATPGHTRDFLSYYIPERRILVASEAVGCEDVSGQIMVEFVADYDAYLASIRRLAELDIEVLCPGHLFVFVGDDARRYIERSLRATERYREWVEALLADEGGDIARVVARVKESEWDPAPQPKQPEQAYLLNTEARVRVLAARRANG